MTSDQAILPSPNTVTNTGVCTTVLADTLFWLHGRSQAFAGHDPLPARWRRLHQMEGYVPPLTPTQLVGRVPAPPQQPPT